MKHVDQSPQAILSRLVPMVSMFCNWFHPIKEKKTFVGKGLLANSKIPEFFLCESCTKHLVIAATMRALCRQEKKIPCSQCQTPCSNPKHRKYMRKIMLMRVATLILTLRWKKVWDHMPGSKDRQTH